MDCGQPLDKGLAKKCKVSPLSCFPLHQDTIDFQKSPINFGDLKSPLMRNTHTQMHTHTQLVVICTGQKVEMGHLGRSRPAQDHNVASGKVGISRIPPKSEDIGKCSPALELK